MRHSRDVTTEHAQEQGQIFRARARTICLVLVIPADIYYSQLDIKGHHYFDETRLHTAFPPSHSLLQPMIAIIISCILLVALGYFSRKRKVLLPPGPPADPIIGHLRIMSSGNPEGAFREWGKTYGAFLSLCPPHILADHLQEMFCTSMSWGRPSLF